MVSGPVMVQVLEGEDAIAKNREVMGATNPADAADGTIRKDFALSIGENSVHGSDAPETAKEEIIKRCYLLVFDINNLVDLNLFRKYLSIGYGT